MDDTGTSFGQWLKRCRGRHDLTQAELADRVGVALVTLRKIESGERRPSKQIALSLAEVLDVPPSDRQAFVDFARAIVAEDGPGALDIALRAAPSLASPTATHHTTGHDGPAGRRGRGNLPLRLSSFIGREVQIAELLGLLLGVRLLTLTGAGGSGKTSLALEVAARLVDVFPDGAWLVDLAPLEDGELLPQVLASTLGFRHDGGAPLREQLLDYLAERQLLLLLDNCEHLIEHCAGLAEFLLSGAAGLKVLATSREPVRVSGETCYNVPSLQTPDPEHLPPLGEAAAYEAMRLFAERAHSAQPGFRITGSNVQAIAEIVTRLDGMPLAIELAAARVRLLAPEQIAARLGDQFSLLTHGRRTALRRQQTLRASLDWSYDLLTGPEAALLNRMAVFAGSFALEAVETVCAGGGHAGGQPPHGLTFTIDRAQVLDLLTSLVEHSLVVVREAPGQNRYRLLETVRQYGVENLASRSELAAVRDRHLAYYLALAEEGAPHIGAGRTAWIDRLSDEYDNFRAAMAVALETNAKAAIRLGKALSMFTFHTARHHDSLAWSKAILTLSDDWPPCGLRATALWFAGDQWFGMADFPRAETVIVSSLNMAREQGDGQQVVESLVTLVDVYRYQHNWQRMAEYGEELVAQCRHAGNPLDLTYALWAMGELALGTGDYEAARRWYDEALGIAQREDFPRYTSHAFRSLGRLAHMEGDLGRAWACFTECARIWRDMKYLRGLQAVMASLGRLALEQGNWQEAQTFFQEQLSLLRDLPVRSRWQVISLEGFAGVAGLAGQAARSARLFGAAERLRDDLRLDVEDRLSPRVYAPLVAGVRMQLGEAAYLAAWSEGRRMPVESAIELAAIPLGHADPELSPDV